MFDQVTIRASDRAASEAFYATVLATLGWARTRSDEGLAAWDDFALAQADDEHRATRRLHLGFVAPSRAHVDAFWQAGIDAGYRDDGPPGPRPQYADDYYGGFLLDPDGNSAEAVHDGALRQDGVIDHLWIRVADLAASRAFFASIAPRAGFAIRHDGPERVAFGAPGAGTFSLVPGEPTRHVHLTFAASEPAALMRDPDGHRVELVDRNRA